MHDTMKKEKNMVKLVIAVFLTLMVLMHSIVLGVIVIQFDRQCTDYLKRAADSNTIELAQNNLDEAIKYMEANNLTSGYTSILYQTPDEDVGFWYNNLKQSQIELAKCSPDATQLEKTNILMKLRETILDDGTRLVITEPSGISRFPYNTLFCIFSIFVYVFVLGGAIIFYGWFWKSHSS